MPLNDLFLKLRRPGLPSDESVLMNESVPMTPVPLTPVPVFCEQCGQAGVNTVAEYVYQSEETGLAGPTMGDPDYWPPNVNGQRLLCQEHYAHLPADSQLDYIPTESRLGRDAATERILL